MITVGVDILDGSFEVDFDYQLLSPRGEEPLRFEPVRQSIRLRPAGGTVPVYISVWMRDLLVANLPEMSEVYLAIAKKEGIDIS